MSNNIRYLLCEIINLSIDFDDLVEWGKTVEVEIRSKNEYVKVYGLSEGFLLSGVVSKEKDFVEIKELDNYGVGSGGTLDDFVRLLKLTNGEYKAVGMYESCDVEKIHSKNGIVTIGKSDLLKELFRSEVS